MEHQRSRSSAFVNWHVKTIAEARRAAKAVSPKAGLLFADDRSIHLAVFNEPFLSYLLDGSKTVESRFSVNRCPPYQRIKAGDLVLIKRTGGPIEAICEIGSVWFYQLDDSGREMIRQQFAKPLCATDQQFWIDRQSASYATLMTVKSVLRIRPVKCGKKDRRGWVVLNQSNTATLFA